MADKSDRDRIEAYLAGIDDKAKREALENLRETVRAAAPDAEEVMTYSMPGFRNDGVLVSYAAHRDHCSFYPMSPAFMDTIEDELEGLRVSKGTIHFTHDKPLKKALVEKIVKGRLAENAARKAKRKGR